MPTPVPKPPEEDFTWWYITLAVLVGALAFVLVWWFKNKKTVAQEQEDNKRAVAKNKKHDDSLDMDKELEWLRKNQEIVDKKRRRKPAANQLKLPKTSEVFNGAQQNGYGESEADLPYDSLDSIPLPVFSFTSIKPAEVFNQLPLSNDEALLSAIEQTHDEDEEDEEVRDLAVRILAAFQTRNSVDALSQVALYDLSSSLRSKAVSVLADFDHESVFEWILLACADPTREVRAAAARGLTRLSFDRAHAWARIMETRDDWRMKHAARAAIEGGFVERSFDRLVHRDEKYAYEAFVLLTFMVRSGEVKQIAEAIKENKDKRVKMALLHVLENVNDQNSLGILYGLLEEPELTDEVKKKIEEIMEKSDMMAHR